jgi:mediator of RNA polymerase II transcription subunit 6
MTISSAIAKALPAAESVRKWRPSLGHVYNLPATQSQARSLKARESKESTPMPDATNKQAVAPTAGPAPQKLDEMSMERAVEESFLVHMRYGGEYIDENPITGRPGDFHLSSTGRKPVPPPQLTQEAGIGTMNGPTINTKIDDKKDGKSDKTPKSATLPKPKRRKSKMGKSTPAATPSAS